MLDGGCRYEQEPLPEAIWGIEGILRLFWGHVGIWIVYFRSRYLGCVGIYDR